MRTLEALPAASTRVLLRVDINAPIENGRVVDHRRFARHAETISRLTERGHAVVVLAHQGRPGRDTFVSLAEHADILADYLDAPVEFVPSVFDDAAEAAIRDVGPGAVLLLENVRMTEDELTDQEPAAHARTALVQTLAPLFDAYVNDGYSVAHRPHASVVGFPAVMDAYAGPVMATEYAYNTAVYDREFDGVVTIVLGGRKAGDVIEALDALADRVDRFLLGGAVGELFLRGAGYPVGTDVGTDFYESYYRTYEQAITDALDRFGDRITLPVDLATASGGDRVETPVAAIDTKAVDYFDIGSETVATYREVIADSAAVLVKGAPGVFEKEPFSLGTCGVLSAIADGDCFSVVGGGDTARAVDRCGFDPAAYDHLSIAGGAYLYALAGRPLPGVVALEEAATRIADDRN